jgi:predicted nucleic acid-binding protein
MIRVFLDANILFSAAYREQNGLLRLWDNEGITLVTSSYAVTEAERNITLKRPNASERLGILTTRIEVSSETRFPAVNHALPPKDQPILAAALGAKCSILLTGDIADFGHLIGKVFDGVHIMTASMFLANNIDV